MAGTPRTPTSPQKRVRTAVFAALAWIIAALLAVLLVKGTVGTALLGASGASGRPASRALLAGTSAADHILAATAKEAPCQPRPALVVLLTTHKTGTAQAGCIKGQVTLGLGIRAAGAATYQNRVDSADEVARFARGPFVDADGVESCQPAAVFTSGDYLPRTEDAQCPNGVHCPCDPETGRARCMSLEAGTLGLPQGNTTVVQVTRHPVDVVLSAYQFHTQLPAPEEWIERVKMDAIGGIWAREGAPADALSRFGGWKATGGFFAAAPGETYGSFLRRLEPEQGVRLEFWRSMASLYGSARQYRSLGAAAAQGQLKFVPVRFEDLQSSFNASAGAILSAFAERIPALDVPRTLEAVQQCNPAAWGPAEQRAKAAHVTAGRDPELRERLRAALLADERIAVHLCELSTALGYDCGVGGDALATA